MENDILDNKDRLMQIWERESRTRDLNVKLMWENLKYFGSLISALITASVTLIGFNIQFGNEYFFLLLIIILQLFIILLAQYAKNDLQERRRRFFLVVSHLLKLEVLLGFYDDSFQTIVSERLKGTRFRDDKHLFAQYFENLRKPDGIGKQDTNTFIDDKMSEKKDNSYSIMSNIYPLMQITIVLLIIGELVLLSPILSYIWKL